MEDLLNLIKKRGLKKEVFLKDLRNFFKNKKKVDEILKKANPRIYTVDFIEEDKISYGITKINSGKIGKENYMTKGHYHKKNVSEVYCLLSGQGKILLRKGKDRKTIKLKKGVFHYVPAGYAHRTVNTGKKQLSFLTTYQTDAGHDYKRIEEEGF